jgi:hypothetical protein
MASVDDLDRRVTALEARVRANEVGMTTVGAKLDSHTAILDSHTAILESHSAKLAELAGGQEVILGSLREHGVLLAHHDARFDGVDAKLDIIVGWIGSQPDS